MKFEEKKTLSPIVVFLKAVDREWLKQEVLNRATWGSDTIDDALDVLLEVADG